MSGQKIQGLPFEGRAPSPRGKKMVSSLLPFSFFSSRQEEVNLHDVYLAIKSNFPMQTKKTLLKNYKNSFVNSALVNWLVQEGFTSDRKSSVSMCEKLFDAGLISTLSKGPHLSSYFSLIAIDGKFRDRSETSQLILTDDESHLNRLLPGRDIEKKEKKRSNPLTKKINIKRPVLSKRRLASDSTGEIVPLTKSLLLRGFEDVDVGTISVHESFLFSSNLL